ncbi:hypothetical protein DSL72_000970 [Monilinia vaccinii-corymbosi]|uniref:BTB domain-containing protein n=1 Tax=Monilinia vaccinii-corymbosi TaxID=61207 RepID=A0A8A3P0H9_9HELO|nr:hypothetical protein DSL72_000970 [Monilinia vaccinii-corymbosi]
MFNTGFKEAEGNSATFLEDLPKAFDILIYWVYSGKIRKSKVSEAWNFLGFYSLAKKLRLVELKDLAFDYYRNNCRIKQIHFDMPWAIEAYRIAPPQSGLRRFVIQLLVWRFQTQHNSEIHANEFFTEIMQSNHEISTDFMLSLRNPVGVSIPDAPRIVDRTAVATRCQYHSHTEDEDCYIVLRV